MTIAIRKNDIGAVRVLTAQYNALRYDVAAARSLFHAHVAGVPTGDGDARTSTPLAISAANATDLPTSITLTRQIVSFYTQHIASKFAHKVADTTNTAVTALPASPVLTDVEATLNSLKTQLNAHYTQSGVHVTNDGTNTIATANATDQTTANALANAIKSALLAHNASAPGGFAINIIDS